MSNAAKAADLLWQARINRQRLARLPADCLPADLPAAYAVQAALTDRLVAHYGGQVAGYKIACTNQAAQQALNVDSPFSGPLLSHAIFNSPANLPVSDFFMRVIEPEFGFELARSLPPKVSAYTRAEVAGAVGAILPAIEIVDSRYEDWTAVGAAGLIADQAQHGAWVAGEPVAAWRHLDLAGHKVELWVNGRLNQTGRGEVVLGHPLKALTWLANDLSQRGQGLKAGDRVTTGVCVDQLYLARAGDVIKADFGQLGVVEVGFIANERPVN